MNENIYRSYHGGKASLDYFLILTMLQWSSFHREFKPDKNQPITIDHFPCRLTVTEEYSVTVVIVGSCSWLVGS